MCHVYVPASLAWYPAALVYHPAGVLGRRIGGVNDIAILIAQLPTTKWVIRERCLGDLLNPTSVSCAIVAIAPTKVNFDVVLRLF